MRRPWPWALPTQHNIWIIDPLDGTHNFTQGIQNCGVMITFAEAEQIQLAVLFNPFKNSMVTAQKSGGVFEQGERKRRQDQEELLNVIADRHGFATVLKEANIDVIDLWSSVNNALLILSGERNAYFNRTAMVWDLAPLSLCFAEFGLRIMHADQRPYQWNSNSQSLIAVPSNLHSQVAT